MKIQKTDKEKLIQIQEKLDAVLATKDRVRYILDDLRAHSTSEGIDRLVEWERELEQQTWKLYDEKNSDD